MPRRSRDLRRKFGLTEDEFVRMVRQQDGKCFICEDRACTHVDHDHVTGNVRGLLCHKCNTAIGYLNENQEILLSAINYLEMHAA